MRLLKPNTNIGKNKSRLPFEKGDIRDNLKNAISSRLGYITITQHRGDSGWIFRGCYAVAIYRIYVFFILFQKMGDANGRK